MQQTFDIVITDHYGMLMSVEIKADSPADAARHAFPVAEAFGPVLEEARTAHGIYLTVE